MTRCLLHVFNLGAVLQGGSDEGSSHRVGRVAPLVADTHGVFPYQATNHIRAHKASRLLALTVVL
jgi:hypothetical protein